MKAFTLDWTRLKRLGSVALAATLLLTLLFQGWLAWTYAYLILHPGCQGDRGSLADHGYEAEAIEFPSRDGLLLRGWYTRGDQHPDVAIIVLTGHGGNTRMTLPDALIFAEAGYSTLIFEHRSCADPSLPATTGYLEAQDVLGAVDYLKTRPDVAHIGGQAYSAGATSLILAAAQEPALEAIIAEGGYASLDSDILDPEDNHNWYDRFMRQLIMWSFHIQLGISPREISPLAVIADISPRPIFLIYGEYEARPGQKLYEAAKEPKELWIVSGAGHGAYMHLAPDEYRERTVDFFDKHLGQ